MMHGRKNIKLVHLFGLRTVQEQVWSGMVDCVGDPSWKEYCTDLSAWVCYIKSALLIVVTFQRMSWNF